MKFKVRDSVRVNPQSQSLFSYPDRDGEIIYLSKYAQRPYFVLFGYGGGTFTEAELELASPPQK